MARQTRQQRRERRAETATAAPPAPPRPPATRNGGSDGGGRKPPVERRGRGSFFNESWAELKKVEWPNQNQVIQGTAVVLIACIIVGAFLYLNDEIWQRVVQKFLLKL